MAVQFCPIASGSSGNSIFVGTGYTGILIDAGLSGKRIQEGLSKICVNPEALDGIFITHEHSDHIQGAGVLSRRFDLPIFATPGTWAAMEESMKVSPKNKRYVYPGENFILNDMCIQPHLISHDAAEPVCYNIIAEKYKIAVATDIGTVDDTLMEHIQDADAILLEANHDVEMLKNGPYPYVLKRRILSDKGHLSNEIAGDLLAKIVTAKLKHIFLGHLSGENNRPALAYETVQQVLLQNKVNPKHFSLDVANRHDVSKLVELS